MKTVILICSFLFLISPCQANTFPHFAVHLNDDYSFSVNKFLPQSSISVDDFKKFDGQSLDYDSFLKSFMQANPDLAGQYVLVHHSGSIQFSSFERPRALLFGRGAVLAFAENPSSLERAVEIIAFNQTSQSFESAELTFRGGQVRFEKNPQTCTTCHGEDIRLLWQPYDLWPTAYGSQAGTFASSQEEAQFNGFLQASAKTGIYNFLKEIETEETRRFNIESFTAYVFSLGTLRANRFLQGLGDRLRPYRFVLMGAANDCTQLSSTMNVSAEPNTRLVEMKEFFPPGIQQNFKNPLSSYEADGAKARQDFLKNLKAQYQRIFPGAKPDFSITNRLDFEVGIIAHVRYILENLGLSWREFIGGHGMNDYSLSQPSHFTFELSNSLIHYQPQTFVELKPEIYKLQDAGIDYDTAWAIFDCKTLKEKSLEALQNIKPSTVAAPFRGHEDLAVGLPVFSRCIQCHASGFANAPYIPFEHTSELRNWLNKNSNKQKALDLLESGKMPIGSALNSQEKQNFIQVLDRISSSL